MDVIYFLGGAHGFIFLITAAIILYTDHRGFNYFRGSESTLPKKFLERSHRLVWAGLALMITTGVFLTIPAWEFRLSEPVFYAKMGFVLILLMNAVAIGKLSQKAATVPFVDLNKEEQITLLVSGGLSASGWISAAVIGFFIL
jgi:hypothetical protein